MSKQSTVWALACAGLASGVVGQAFGQSEGSSGSNADHFNRDRNTSVSQRREAREEESGYRAGLFRILPSLSLQAGYTDNYSANELDDDPAIIYRARAGLDIESDWSRHLLGLHFAIPTTAYEGDDDGAEYYTTTDYLASIDGQLDVDRTFSISGGLDFADNAEAVGFADPAITLEEPARLQASQARLAFAKTFNRVRIAGSASYGMSDYEDVELAGGGAVNVDVRDVNTTQYSLRAEAAVTDSTSIFVQASANEREYELQPPDIPASRDSSGQTYMAGISFDISNLSRGEISVGTLTQEYDDPTLPEQEGTTARVAVEFFPDELVTIAAAAERSIQDANTADAATVLGTDANLDLVYEFRRDLSLSVGAGYSEDEYIGIDREDTRWSANASVGYDINRNVAVTFSVGYTEQQSDGADAGRNYESATGLIGITLRR